MSIKIPLGIENFAKMREENFYYVDKTAFIKELLEKQFEASLVTRPRRFGKTLTMSMLEDFFDVSRDSKRHFEGLAISKEVALCKEWLNQWPVLFLTLKSIEGLTFEFAYDRLKVLLATLAREKRFLLENPDIDKNDKLDFSALCDKSGNAAAVTDGLLLLTRMMRVYYGKPVILLIDEYDVPLAKASENGYYDEMLDVIRALLGGALKTNPNLKFAVVTGCLRISKESIFTGVNNFVTDAITGDGFNEYIGFTPNEVTNILKDTDLLDHADEIKKWYDGYRFGKVEVYCPWAVLSHINALQNNPEALPENYWANTSHNGIIYHFISRRLQNVKDKFDTLMDGGVLVTPVEKNLTYDYLKSSEKNFWSLLYLTGYLTSADPAMLKEPVSQGYVALRIPNEEVKRIFKDAIIDWFNDYVVKIDRREMCDALWNGNAEKAESMISRLLFKTISYHDYEESYYHAFLAGLFAGDEYGVESNNEYGFGRPDIVVKDDDNQRAMVMEVKYAKTEQEIAAKKVEALNQIADRHYLEGIDDGYTTKIAYGVVFHKKKCFVVKAEK